MKLLLSSTNTLLRSLQHCEYLIREGDRGAFRLTGKVLALAHTARSEMSLAMIAEPHLKALRDETRLTAILSVRERDHVAYIAKARGESLVQLNTYVGKSIPMHLSASGRSILAKPST